MGINNDNGVTTTSGDAYCEAQGLVCTNTWTINSWCTPSSANPSDCSTVRGDDFKIDCGLAPSSSPTTTPAPTMQPFSLVTKLIDNHPSHIQHRIAFSADGSVIFVLRSDQGYL